MSLTISLPSKKIPNILLLTKRFSPPYIGGVPNYYRNLLLNLRKVQTTVITKSIDRQNVGDKCPFGDNIYHNHRINRVVFFPDHMGAQISFPWTIAILKMVNCINKTVKEKKIDFIVVGQAQIFLTLAAFCAGFITKKPYILFLHGEEIPQIYLKSNNLLRFLYLHASGYFCNSNFTMERLLIFLRSDTIAPVIITPGVEDRFFERTEHTHLKKKLGIEGRKVIYTIARADERKGQDMVIKAMPLIIKKHPDVIYLIGGKGLRLHHLKKLSNKMNLSNYVKFLGFVREEDIVPYHYAGDIFVMPNRILEDGDSEGFGIVFLEANAAGVPVIGGNEGGSVDAIVDGITGYMVDPRDKYDIAQKICTLLENDELCKRMGQAGRKRCWEEFRWPSLAARFEDGILALWQSIGR